MVYAIPGSIQIQQKLTQQPFYLYVPSQVFLIKMLKVDYNVQKRVMYVRRYDALRIMWQVC